MKIYTAFLEMLILFFLILTITFRLTDDYITNSVIGKRGIHITIICWQTFFVIASFCMFLRYIARNVR